MQKTEALDGLISLPKVSARLRRILTDTRPLAMIWALDQLAHEATLKRRKPCQGCRPGGGHEWRVNEAQRAKRGCSRYNLC